MGKNEGNEYEKGREERKGLSFNMGNLHYGTGKTDSNLMSK